MTSTPVKNLDPLIQSYSSGKTEKRSEGSFRAVWDKQAGQAANQFGNDSGDLSKLQSEKTDRHKEGTLIHSVDQTAEKPSAETQSAEGAKAVNQPKDSGKEIPADDQDTQMQQEAMEVLVTALGIFVTQIVEELGLSEEEFRNLLSELGMTEADLLSTEGLLAVVMAVGGEEDMLSLLTNEDLCGSYQELSNQQQDLLAACKAETSMEPEQLQHLLTREIAEYLQPAEEETAIPYEPLTILPDKPEEDTLPIVRDSDSQEESEADTLQPENTANTVTKEAVSLKKKDTADNSGQNSSLFQSDFTDHTAKAQDVDVQAANPAYQMPDTESVMQQILDYMKIQMEPDMTHLEMQLHPESLGTLQIHLAAREGVVTAQFIAQDEAVKTALESQMIRLVESFQEQGIKVDAVEVTVQTHEFEQNLNQGRNNEQETDGNKQRIRRLNLDSPMDLEELTQEEQLTAEMMAANGNTVDYTA